MPPLLTSVHTEGYDEAYRKIINHKRIMTSGELSEVALVGARTMQSLITLEMGEAKSGEWYDRPWLRVPSSAPGEMPAIQMADLVNSMKAEKMTAAPGEGKAKLETDHKHAIWMEFGWTDRGGNFNIRPFMRPGVDKYRGEIIGAMKTAMRQMKRY